MQKVPFRHYLWMLLTGTGVFYLLTLRDGHPGNDFFILMRHVINMLEGQPYAADPFVMYPEGVVPPQYNPAFPFVLLPVYAASGVNLWAMKVLMVFCFVLSLAVLTRVFRKDLPDVLVLITLGLIAFQPYFWEIKDHVMTDLPFLLTTALCFVLIARLDDVDLPTSDGLRASFLIGLGIFLSVMTRSIGFTLLVSLFFYDLIKARSRLPTRRFWIPLMVVLIGITIQQMMLPIESNRYYVSIFLTHLQEPLSFVRSILEHGRIYLHDATVNTLFGNGYVAPIRYLVGSMMLLMAGYGYVQHIRRRFAFFDVFVVIYVGILLIYPATTTRYLLPLHVLLFFYAVYGLYQFQPKRIGSCALYGCCALVFSTYAFNFTMRDFQHVTYDVASPASRAMYAYIAEHTPIDAVFVFREPHVLALYAERRSTMPEMPAEGRMRFNTVEAEAAFAHFDTVGAEYLLAGPYGPRPSLTDIFPFWLLPQDHPNHFERLFDTGEMILYRIKHHPERTQ